ncbi:unnamed protein product [Anisakis simplex]|uniref:Phosphotransferase n=1 Tax=Anisakis simplex TaxID=6269 RepID=A0A0M3JPU8_ANISI|nr:unnamed protein product [Anisakis simplex]
MIGEGSTNVVTVKCLEEVDLLTNCELIDFGVDRSTKPIALFALTSDKRVIRFSSAKAPDYLTVASGLLIH